MNTENRLQDPARDRDKDKDKDRIPSPFSLREIAGVLASVARADDVMEKIVGDVDAISFQSAVLALGGKAAEEVEALRSQTRTLRTLTEKLGCLVGLLAEDRTTGAGLPRLGLHSRNRRLAPHLVPIPLPCRRGGRAGGPVSGFPGGDSGVGLAA